MGITVSEALSLVYKLEAEERTRVKAVNKAIDSLEEYSKEISEKDVSELNKHGINIVPLISVDFEKIRNDYNAQKDYIELVNNTIQKTIDSVEEYYKTCR